MWDDASELERELARILRDSMNIDYPPDMPMDLNTTIDDEAAKRRWWNLWRARGPTAAGRADPEQ